jgi:hypothetical protein
MQNNVSANMKRSATITELVLAIVTFVGSIVASWVNINSRVSVLESQIIDQKQTQNELKSDMKEVKQNTVEILLKMEKKADRQQ